MPRTLSGSNPSPPNKRTEVRIRGDAWQVSLVNVPSGVAAGRTQRHRGNVLTESWTLFVNRDQFELCSAGDPLRFADPHLFAQIMKEFDHVFERFDPCDGCS